MIFNLVKTVLLQFVGLVVNALNSIGFIILGAWLIFGHNGVYSPHSTLTLIFGIIMLAAGVVEGIHQLHKVVGYFETKWAAEKEMLDF